VCGLGEKVVFRVITVPNRRVLQTFTHYSQWQRIFSPCCHFSPLRVVSHKSDLMIIDTKLFDLNLCGLRSVERIPSRLFIMNGFALASVPENPLLRRGMRPAQQITNNICVDISECELIRWLKFTTSRCLQRIFTHINYHSNYPF
jgi:hypothetical protein